MAILSRISVRPPMRLAGLRFHELFAWLSSSLSDLSRSQLGSVVPFQRPGWAQA